MLEESKKVLNRLGIEIPSLRNKIKNFSGGQRQSVAISRSIYWNAKLPITDEPTAALGVADQRKVLNLVRTLSEQGVYYYHQPRAHDVFQVAHRLMVLRWGEKVGEHLTHETNPNEIVSLMVGAELVQGVSREKEENLGRVAQVFTLSRIGLFLLRTLDRSSREAGLRKEYPVLSRRRGHPLPGRTHTHRQDTRIGPHYPSFSQNFSKIQKPRGGLKSSPGKNYFTHTS